MYHNAINIPKKRDKDSAYAHMGGCIFTACQGEIYFEKRFYSLFFYSTCRNTADDVFREYRKYYKNRDYRN